MTSETTNIRYGRRLIVANVIEEARIGGPQNRIADVASLLLAEGIETIVILPDENSANFVEKLEHVGVSFRTLNLRKLSRNFRELVLFAISFPLDVMRVRDAIRDCGADLVHCNSAGQWKGVLAAALLRRPVLWHLNDTNMPWPIRLVFGTLARSITTGFIVAANRVATYYLGGSLAASKRFLVPAPVDCARFDPAIEPRNSDMRQPDTVTICHVGNVSPVKDVLTYVRAAQIVGSRIGRNVRFLQVGAHFKTQDRYVMQVIDMNTNGEGKAVELLGAQQDVRPILASSDIYVCSSAYEASPVSVWEAMAMGLPIVTTDVGDVADMNIEGDFARVVSTGDPDALATELIALCSDPAERQRLGANARTFALANLDLKTCVARHRDTYHAVVAHEP